MALPQYDTEELIANIKRRCAVPTSQLTYTDSDFADLANDELQGEVVPLIMSNREEYFVDFVDVPSVASGYIDFPSGAVGAKLRSVCYYQNTTPLTLINLPRLDLDVVAGVGFANYTNVVGFFIEGNSIVLYPANSVPVGTTIRLYYYKRALKLAAPSTYGQVLTVDSGTNTITVDFAPADWAIGTVLNTVSGQPNFNITNEECTISSISSPTIILDSVTGIAVGDFISTQGYSAVPQIPVEAHAYLAQLTAAKALEGLGDSQGMKNALEKAMQLKQNLLIMISNRVDGSPKKVINPSGGLRAMAGTWRRGWGIW